MCLTRLIHYKHQTVYFTGTNPLSHILRWAWVVPWDIQKHYLFQIKSHSFILFWQDFISVSIPYILCNYWQEGLEGCKSSKIISVDINYWRWRVNKYGSVFFSFNTDKSADIFNGQLIAINTNTIALCLWYCKQRS